MSSTRVLMNVIEQELPTGGFLPDGTQVNNAHRFWVSAYAKPGKVLVVVVRDSPAGDCSPIVVNLKLDRKRLGLPDGALRCSNFESFGRTELGRVDGDVLKVEVPSISVSTSGTLVGVIIEPVK